MLYILGKSVVAAAALLTIGFITQGDLTQQSSQPKQSIATNHKCGCTNNNSCFPCPE